jgi:hypothetical protein
MYKIRCKDCNQELVAQDLRGQSCKCPNGAYVRLDRNEQPVIIAADLNRVEMISNSFKQKFKSNQEIIDMPKRRIRRLDFEVR